MKRGRTSDLYDERGFTLIEAALVVIVIGMLAVISVPRMLVTDRHVAYTAAQQIRADMRYARGLAIASATQHNLIFSPVSGPYTGYSILRNGEVIPVKSTEISADVICSPIGGFSENLGFTSLGSTLSNGTILSLTRGTSTQSISVTGATGRIY